METREHVYIDISGTIRHAGVHSPGTAEVHKNTAEVHKNTAEVQKNTAEVQKIAAAHE